MDASVLVEVIAAPTAAVVAALSYLFTKMKEREADWRKWKYEQYKEFMFSISGSLGRDPTPDGKRSFARACNALHLIGSRDVILALHALLDAVDDPGLSRTTHDALLSKLILEIRRDVGIPGTPDASEFFVRLWGSGANSTGK